MSLNEFVAAVDWIVEEEPVGDRSRTSLREHVRHQFTVENDEKIVLCVASRLSEHPTQFHILFVEDRLEGIVEPPPFDHTFKLFEDGGSGQSRIRVTQAADPQERVRLVLGARRLTVKEAADLAEEQHEAAEKAVHRHSESLPVPRWLMGPATAGEAARDADDEAAFMRYVELRQRYDPLEIRLGMEISDVANRMGPAIHTKAVGEDVVVHIFGPNGRIGRWRLPRTAVKFRNRRVTAIYSESFYDPESALGGRVWTGRGSSE
jgi:hypothetical protein